MTTVLSQEKKNELLTIIEKYAHKEGGLINILNEVQESMGHIPYQAQKLIAETLDMPLIEIYGVVTFYSRFTLEPVGKYKIGVCMGTACYVRGSNEILAETEALLDIKTGETTADGMFSIESTRCIGACGLAPVVVINDDVYGNLEKGQMEKIIDKYREDV